MLIKIIPGDIMGKVTIELNEEDHKKLKLICTDKNIKIKEYVLAVVQEQIKKDIVNLEVIQEILNQNG